MKVVMTCVGNLPHKLLQLQSTGQANSATKLRRGLFPLFHLEIALGFGVNVDGLVYFLEHIPNPKDINPFGLTSSLKG